MNFIDRFFKSPQISKFDANPSSGSRVVPCWRPGGRADGRTDYSCPILMKLEYCRQIFENSVNIKIWWKSIQWEPSCVHADGRAGGWTDGRTDGLFCPILMKLEFYGQVFEKSPNIKIWCKSVKWEPSCSMRTDGHDEVNGRISQFCEGP